MKTNAHVHETSLAQEKGAIFLKKSVGEVLISLLQAIESLLHMASVMQDLWLPSQLQTTDNDPRLVFNFCPTEGRRLC